MAGQSGQTRAPAARKGPGIGGFIGIFFLVLLLELFLDVVLLPADEVLIPAEVLGDALFFTVGIIGAWRGSQCSGSGRQVGGSKSRAITTTARVVRGNRRGVLRLQGSRRAALSGGQVGLIAGIWLLFVAVIAFQWWWSIHHPILQLLTLPFEILFDILGVLVSVVVTVFTLTGMRPGASGGRQVGA